MSLTADRGCREAGDVAQRETVVVMMIAMFVVALPALAGCGSDPLSEQELIARGDALCRESRKQFAEVQAEPPQVASQAASQAERLVDAASTELEGLRELQPPKELSEQYDAYLEKKEDALELIESGRDAAADKDSSRYGELQDELAEGAPKRAELAREVGFKVCSRGRGIPRRG